MPHDSPVVAARVAVDAYVTTGTSPGARARAYDTIHLLGPGAVGRALLRRLPDSRRRLIAVTDSTATLHDPRGLDIGEIAEWKLAGRPLREHPTAHAIDAAAALELVDADIVVDCTATDLDRIGWTAALTRALERGACVVLAAKASLCDAAAEWLSSEHGARVGCNAVLGGTGRRFVNELNELADAVGIVIVGNASTTSVVDVLERGGTLQEGVAEAQRLGYLEPDPEQDLRGTDAAVKLAIVAGAVTGRRIDPRTIACDDLRDVDPFIVRARARRGNTTRLVARFTRDGGLRVGYEEVSRESLLAVPCGQVVYEYRFARGERRFHFGTGLGADATAEAVWTDIRHIAARAAVRSQRLEVAP